MQCEWNLIDLFLLELDVQQQQSDSRASDTHLSGSSTSSCTSATSEHDHLRSVPPTLPEPSVDQTPTEQPQAATVDETDPINLVLRMR